VAMPERRAPKARHGVDIGLALAIVDIDALPTLDHQRSALAEGGEIRVGVDDRLDIADSKITEHDRIRSWSAAFWIASARQLGETARVSMPSDYGPVVATSGGAVAKQIWQERRRHTRRPSEFFRRKRKVVGTR